MKKQIIVITLKIFLTSNIFCQEITGSWLVTDAYYSYTLTHSNDQTKYSSIVHKNIIFTFSNDVLKINNDFCRHSKGLTYYWCWFDNYNSKCNIKILEKENNKMVLYLPYLGMHTMDRTVCFKIFLTKIDDN